MNCSKLLKIIIVLAIIFSFLTGNVYAYTYNTLGLRTQTQYLNGITTNYGYDALSRLTEISSSTLSAIRYTLDNVGNRAVMTDAEGARNYTYDRIYQLLSVTGADNASFTPLERPCPWRGSFEANAWGLKPRAGFFVRKVETFLTGFTYDRLGNSMTKIPI